MSEDKKDENVVSPPEGEDNTDNFDNQPKVDDKALDQSDKTDISKQNISQNTENTDESSKSDQNETTEHQVIHKKDGRLHIYIRQDKYKGELKSKNWVGRLYIDGKQKISSSGTPNLDEAIPILEKWFDDIHTESEKQKKLAEESQQSSVEQPNATPKVEETVSPVVSSTVPQATSENIDKKVEVPVINNDTVLNNEVNEKIKEDVSDSAKNKVSNILGKFKNLKFKKPSLKGIKLPKSPVKSKNNSLTKVIDFIKSKIGRSSVQGEEVIGVELTNKEIRLAQINSDKSNQWVLEKFYTHKIDIPDESSVLENAEKVTTELSLALQKSKVDVGNVVISIPVLAQL